MGLRYWFRTQRALIDAIFERDAKIIDLTARVDQLAGAESDRDSLLRQRDQLQAANARLAKVTTEANAALERNEAQAVTIANLSRHVEQCQVERDALKQTVDTAAAHAEVLAKERDDAIRQAFGFSTLLNRIDAILHPPIEADPGDDDFVRDSAQDQADDAEAEKAHA